jgi:hypothetical protein
LAGCSFPFLIWVRFAMGRKRSCSRLWSAGLIRTFINNRNKAPHTAVWAAGRSIALACHRTAAALLNSARPIEGGTLAMTDQIAELHELMEAYRRRSEIVRFTPVATAYAEAADQLEQVIAEAAGSPPQASYVTAKPLL